MVPQFVAPVRVEAYTSIAALATAVRNECDADARPTLAEVTHTLSAWAGGDSVDPEPADLSPGAAWWAPGHAPVDPPEAAKVKLAAAAAGRAFHAASLPMGGVGGGPIPPPSHTHTRTCASPSSSTSPRRATGRRGCLRRRSRCARRAPRCRRSCEARWRTCAAPTRRASTRSWPSATSGRRTGPWWWPARRSRTRRRGWCVLPRGLVTLGTTSLDEFGARALAALNTTFTIAGALHPMHVLAAAGRAAGRRRRRRHALPVRRWRRRGRSAGRQRRRDAGKRRVVSWTERELNARGTRAHARARSREGSMTWGRTAQTKCIREC